jgi:phosphoribosylaminoimidazole-succinocarboxamide synthase
MAVLHADAPGLELVRRGKVRDVLRCGDRLLIVATDRISAFDVVLPNGIPGKGEVLTAVSAFWFRKLEGTAHHHLVDEAEEAEVLAGLPASLRRRTAVAREAEPVLVECVARSHIAGSLYKEYADGSAGRLGLRLPPGLRDGDRLPEPVFTPATKAQAGHDENISFDQMVETVGPGPAEELRAKTMALFAAAAAHASACGLILADAKLEFGWEEGRLVWIDEAFTPDSSRYWEEKDWRPGGPQPSFDKQFVRDWLAASGWDRNPPAPRLPDEVVAATQAKYAECCARLTGAAPG